MSEMHAIGSSENSVREPEGKREYLIKALVSANQPNNQLCNLICPWSRVLLERLTSPRLVKKFPALYGTCRANIAPEPCIQLCFHP